MTTPVANAPKVCRRIGGANCRLQTRPTHRCSCAAVMRMKIPVCLCKQLQAEWTILKRLVCVKCATWTGIISQSWCRYSFYIRGKHTYCESDSFPDNSSSIIKLCTSYWKSYSWDNFPSDGKEAYEMGQMQRKNEETLLNCSLFSFKRTHHTYLLCCLFFIYVYFCRRESISY